MGATITQMEMELRELIRLWDRHFSGDIRIPPLKEKTALARRLRQLSEHPPRRSADRFRAEQLQHRFAAYAASWERMLREKEEGIQRGRPLRRISAVPTAAPAVPAANVPPLKTVDMAEDLYSRWKTAKASLGRESRMSREAFEKKLEIQRRQLEQKLGCGVSFDVKVDGGKVKLTARKKASASNGE